MNRLAPNGCDPSHYNDEGTPTYVSFGIGLAHCVDGLNFLAQMFLLVVALLIYVPIYAFELLFGPRLAPFIFASITIGSAWEVGTTVKHQNDKRKAIKSNKTTKAGSNKSD